MTAKQNSQMQKPELMSPAGHWPQLNAAVNAGADAVYFGLQHFSARAKVGFTLDELSDAIETLHRNAVKGFVTFNTLVFDHELEQAAQAIVEIEASGADAIIVQDIGIATLAREIAPGLEVHGSTQMSVTSAEGVELAASLGCTRVVLGRELDLKDIRRIALATDVELEVFVHGALCVSYSGQCFSSEAWGGRSANRGQCAQACRLSYDLIVDDQERDLGAHRYLLSPGDLYALEQVPELIDIGVACLKIEGRYKDEDYVSLTTRAYRDAIDTAFDSQQTAADVVVTKKELEQIYSRGLGPHFMSGTNHQSVVVGRAPRHRGLPVGSVVEVRRNSVVVQFEHEIRPGDGIVFDSADWRTPDEPEEGGNVFESNPVDERLSELKFGRGDIDFNRIRVGDPVWRTNDPLLKKKCRNLRKFKSKTMGLSFDVVARLGSPLLITGESERGEEATFVGGDVLGIADSYTLTTRVLKQQLGRLGGTPFHLHEVTLATDESVFCPVSVINQARRDIVAQIIEQRIQKPQRTTCQLVDGKKSNQLKQTDDATRSLTVEEWAKSRLHLLIRTPQQLEAAIRCRPASITLDYLDLYGLRPSVERIKQAGLTARVASPRILKPSEQKVVRFLLSLNCQILVRSGGLLHDLVTNNRDEQGSVPELFGDFSLNAANAVAFHRYMEMGLVRITPSHDLNAKQITELTQAVPPDQLETIIFHHLPVFHTEHCVFCRFLSDGTDNTNCGHPCETHRVSLRDNNGRRHPIMADVGCRNTIFGAEAQTGNRYLREWTKAGLRDFRIEFVHQNGVEVEAITAAFNSFLSQETNLLDLDHSLRSLTPQGITAGSLFVPKDFKNLVQLNQ